MSAEDAANVDEGVPEVDYDEPESATAMDPEAGADASARPETTPAESHPAAQPGDTAQQGIAAAEAGGASALMDAAGPVDGPASAPADTEMAEEAPSAALLEEAEPQETVLGDGAAAGATVSTAEEGRPEVSTADAGPVAPAATDTAATDTAATDTAEQNGTAHDGAKDAAAGSTFLEPPHGTELFVGGVPRATSEAQLKAFAEEAGDVYNVVLLKDPANPEQNRGYGFIKYRTRESATKALDKLQGRELPDFPGNKLRIAHADKKHKLYIGNIPRQMKAEDLEEIVKKSCQGLEKVELLMSKEYPGENRGFGFLEFYNNTCANAAKAILSAPSYKMGGRSLTVSYAEPKMNDQNAQAASQVKAVYVGNLPANATDAKLKEAFEGHGTVVNVVIPPARDGKPHREYGFVHFAERATMLKVLEEAEKGSKPSMDGQELDVKMAKPQVQPQDRQQGLGGGGSMAGSGGFAGGRGGGFGGGARGGMSRGNRGGRMGGYGMGASGSRGYGRGAMDYAQADYGTYGGYEDQGYGGGYDEGYGAAEYGYGAGYEDYGGGYGAGAYGGHGAAGMAMVPMMLPNGQVGYVLSGGGAAGFGAGTGAAGGPIRSPSARGSFGRGGGSAYGGGMARGRGRMGGSGGYGAGGGGQRFRPY